MSQPLSYEQRLRLIHHKLEHDEQFYFKKCLRISPKAGGALIPLVLNRAQKYAHDMVEQQLKDTGKVRAIIIKGRQQGFSTWIAGRFFKKTTKEPNKSTFIVSHQEKTTSELFGKVDTYYKNLPDSLRVKTVEDNKSTMVFDNGSRYQVGTAGNGEVGRGTTNQYLHLSEAAFYMFPDKIAAGVMNSVSDEPGTEIILETTVNGIGNWFHNFTLKALAGKSEYIVIFVPWFWQEEYRAKVRPDFAPTAEEVALQELYGLDIEQLQWRRNKMATYEDINTFNREYPNSLEDAFRAASESLFSQTKVEAAASREIKVSETVPIICGVDASGTGADSTSFFWRQGDKAIKRKQITGSMDEMRLAGMIINMIEDKEGDDYADMFFLDYAYAYGAISRIQELGYGEFVQGVYFAETSTMLRPETYLNKRAEMFGTARTWFNGHVQYLSDNLSSTALLSIPNFVPTSNGKFKLPPKLEIRAKLGAAAADGILDIADSFVLTFAAPVYESKRNILVRTELGLRVVQNKQGVGGQKFAKANGPVLKSKERMRRR